MPSVMTGRSRSRARWSVIARTDSRAPLGRQRDRHSGSGDRAGRRLRVKHRRIAVSRNGDPDSKRAPGRSGENVGRVQHAKDNDQSPHALAPGGRSPVRKCGGAVPRRDGSVRRQARDRDICQGAARAEPCRSSGSLDRCVAVVGSKLGLAMPPAPARAHPTQCVTSQRLYDRGLTQQLNGRTKWTPSSRR